MILDSAIYVDGRRVAEPSSLRQTCEARRELDGVAWIGLHSPSQEEFSAVAKEFGLHPLAVEDTVKAHQRPKLERYGENLFVVLRPAHYLDNLETVEFGEIHVFVGENFVVSVRHGEASELRQVRRRLESEPELLRHGPMAILYAIMDRVVDEYAPVVEGLQTDIDEIEEEVFGGNAGVSRRIYALAREVIGFRRAVEPLTPIVEGLTKGEVYAVFDTELRRHLRDVQDHVMQVTERVEGFHELLRNILDVNLTLVGISQNDETKKISAWAAIIAVPTIITGIYGMNFDYMPELHWWLGYPYALALILVMGLVLHRLFKRSGWL
jgi:magnesium transporter